MDGRAAGRHIVINALKLSVDASYRNAGIAKIIYRLVQELQRLDRSNCYTVLLSEGVWPEELAGVENFRLLQVPGIPPGSRGKRVLWEQSALPLWLRRLGADVVHAPVNVVPLASPTPSVVTVHDLSFLLVPERFPASQRRYLRLFAALTIRRARRVMTDSEHTRRDVIRLLGADPERVVTVYPGLDPEFAPCPDAERVAAFRRERGLGERPILFLGTLEPRKNVDKLVRAYALLRAQGLLAGQRLVLGGGRGWFYQAIFDTIRALGLDNEVCLPGYVPAEELPLWYNSAEVFVYPSAYEGFGLPPLEAMACGVPVITSNRSSLPEVVGDAGICVPPGDVAALAEALRRVTGDPELRARMRARGLAQAHRFRWEDTARRALDVYERAAE